MKPQQQPQKKKRPRGEFRVTGTGFILNGREVIVEYRKKRQPDERVVTKPAE